LVLVVQRASRGELQPGATFKVHGQARVGRDPSLEVCLPDRTVSRLHAALREQPQGWVVENLTAHNGVFVDGQRVPAHQRAVLSEDARELQIGGVMLRVHVMLGTWPVIEPMQAGAPALRLVRDGDGCSLFCGERFVPIKPSSALALYALARQPGQVVHSWDLTEAMGRNYHLPQAISGARRALRGLMEHGEISPRRVLGWVAEASGGEPMQELEALDPEKLARRLVMARRGHGYILMVPPGVFSTEEAG
jgi:hypothetical protein